MSPNPTVASSRSSRRSLAALAHGGDTARVVVLGGGYAGALAANRLAGRLGRRARITVIEERDELVHRVRLHEVLAGGPGKAYPLAELLHREVHHVQARATRIDAASGCVELEGGSREPFDHLVVAVGSRLAGAIPGALSHGGGITSPEAALRAHERLVSLGERERVVVIGGGLTGVEVATEIAERHARLCVVLLARRILPGLSDRARAYAERVIAELGIERHEGEAVEIDAGGVVLRGGARLDAGLVVWAGGFAPQGPAVASELARDASGRLLVDASLQAVGHERIWVCGDAAAPPPGLGFARMGCALAMPMGAHAADNVARAVRGEAPAAFRFGYAGQCISLGRKRGLVQLVSPEDRPRDRFVSGRMGALVKELISTLVIGALRVERLCAGAYGWPRSVEARHHTPALPASRAQVSVGG